MDAINAPRDFVQSKPLIENRSPLRLEQLADAGTALKDLGL